MPFPATDWGDFTPTEYQVGAPASSLHFERWFRNVVAAFQGASNAPRLQLAALENPTAGVVIRSRYDPTVETTELIADAFSFAFGQTGTVRVTGAHRVSNGTATGTLNIVRLRNSVSTVVATWTTSSTSFVVRTVDVAVLPGDLVTFQYGAFGVSSPSTYLQNCRFQTNGEALWPFNSTPLE